MAVSHYGLADGFLRGFQVMDNHLSNQRRLGLADAQERRNATMQDKRMGLAEAQDTRNAEIHATQMAQAGRQEQAAMAQQFYARLAAGGEPGEKDLAFIYDNPEWSPGFLGGEETTKALGNFEAVINRKLPTNSPEALSAANHLFFNDVQKGSPGKKSISSITHSVKVDPKADPDTLLIGLDVDGQRKPMTVGRGVSDDNTEVMQVPIDALVKRAAGIKKMHQYLTSPEGKAAMQKYGNAMGWTKGEQWSDVQFKPGMGYYTKNLTTGEIKQLNVDKSFYSGKGDGKLSGGMSTYKEDQYTIDQYGTASKAASNQLWVDDKGTVYENYKGVRTPQRDIPFIKASEAIVGNFGVDVSQDETAKQLFQSNNKAKLYAYLQQKAQEQQPQKPAATQAARTAQGVQPPQRRPLPNDFNHQPQRRGLEMRSAYREYAANADANNPPMAYEQWLQTYHPDYAQWLSRQQ